MADDWTYTRVSTGVDGIQLEWLDRVYASRDLRYLALLNRSRPDPDVPESKTGGPYGWYWKDTKTGRTERITPPVDMTLAEASAAFNDDSVHIKSIRATAAPACVLSPGGTRLALNQSLTASETLTPEDVAKGVRAPGGLGEHQLNRLFIADVGDAPQFHRVVPKEPAGYTFKVSLLRAVGDGAIRDDGNPDTASHGYLICDGSMIKNGGDGSHFEVVSGVYHIDLKTGDVTLIVARAADGTGITIDNVTASDDGETVAFGTAGALTPDDKNNAYDAWLAHHENGKFALRGLTLNAPKNENGIIGGTTASRVAPDARSLVIHSDNAGLVRPGNSDTHVNPYAVIDLKTNRISELPAYYDERTEVVCNLVGFLADGIRRHGLYGRSIIRRRFHFAVGRHEQAFQRRGHRHVSSDGGQPRRSDISDGFQWRIHQRRHQ